MNTGYYLGQQNLYQNSKHFNSWEDVVDYVIAGSKGKTGTLRRRVANSIYFEQVNDQLIRLFLFKTCVMSFRPDAIVLNSGGYRTMTTKEVINEFLPKHTYVVQFNRMWYIGTTNWIPNSSEARSLFYEGIAIRYDGSVVEPRQPEDTEKAVKELKKAIKKYAQGFVEHLKDIKLPSEGDCWHCAGEIADEPGVYLDDKTGNTNHYKMHMGLTRDENGDPEEPEPYYVPSLVWRALKEKGLGDVGVLMWLGWDNTTQTFGNRWADPQRVQQAIYDFLWKRLSPEVLNGVKEEALERE